MTSNDSTDRGGPLVFGVAGSAVAEALREAGLDEGAVVAILGRAVARSAAIPPDASARFAFQVTIEERAPECALAYQRTFVHPDFVDGESRVQGGMTPEELGFNARFHAIEAEFDAVSHDLRTASSCVAELRRELFQLARELESKITEIEARLSTKAGKEIKEVKETKESKDGKETKETAKDGKETKETKETAKETNKDSDKATAKEDKDFDKIAKESDKAAKDFEKATAKEAMESAALRSSSSKPWPSVPRTGSPAGRARTFIAAEDRPDVQAAALGEDQEAAALGEDQEADTGPADEADRTRHTTREPPGSEAPESPPS